MPRKLTSRLACSDLRTEFRSPGSGAFWPAPQLAEADVSPTRRPLQSRGMVPLKLTVGGGGAARRVKVSGGKG